MTISEEEEADCRCTRDVATLMNSRDERKSISGRTIRRAIIDEFYNDGRGREKVRAEVRRCGVALKHLQQPTAFTLICAMSTSMVTARRSTRGRYKCTFCWVTVCNGVMRHVVANLRAPSDKATKLTARSKLRREPLCKRLVLNITRFAVSADGGCYRIG